ncbi:MAG: sulfatase-like hydrolase/transferase [Candidatus Aminicenantales bacterium]
MMRKNLSFFFLFVALIVLTASFSPLIAKPRIKRERLNLLLISVDTLRADYLSCNQAEEVKTPNIDSLVENGVLFQRAFAHNPLTLPSHVNILTGMTPLFHGVHENIGFRLADDILTMAEYLKKQGYETAAFVGAFPLDSRFGLTQGFDVYDDFYGDKKSPGAFFFVERKAEEVISRTLDWLKNHPQKKWFVFVHLFDPHQPYIPPSPYSERYADNLYAGEVAYVDECMGKLFRYLRESGLMAETLVVFTSDHGEALGEHGERTHGYFAYNSTLHVPLLLHSRRFFKQEKTVDHKVSHVDIFPTICDLFGLKPPPFLQGQSVLPLIEGGKFREKPIYFESLSAYYNRNWAPLRGMIQGEEKFIDLPLPELYDLRTDFKEEKNLAAQKDINGYKRSLDLLMDTLSRGRPVAKRRRETKETLEAMKSLGYLGGRTTPKKVFSKEDDLKTLLPYHLRLMDASSSYSQNNAEEAARILEELIKEKKDFVAAYEYLANVYHETGRMARAIEVLKRGLQYSPSHAQLRGKLGIFLSEVGRVKEAIEELKGALSLNEEDAELWNFLGVAYWRNNQWENAEECYRRALALDTDYASAFNNLGSLFLSRKDPDKALSYFDQAIGFDPSLASAYNGKAVALGMKGRLEEAVVNWKKAVEYEPDHRMALYNLGLALLRMNQREEALPYLEKYLEVAPTDDPDREKISRLVEWLKNLR